MSLWDDLSDDDLFGTPQPKINFNKFGITFDMPKEITDHLKELRIWGILRQNNVKYACSNWGNVYLQIDSNIKQILAYNELKQSLLSELKKQVSKQYNGKETYLDIKKLETNIPSHISVISSYEFQSKFFTGKANVKYNPILAIVPQSENEAKEMTKRINLKKDISFEKYEVPSVYHLRKVNDLLMYKYFKKYSLIGRILPKEIMKLIKSFLILKINELEQKFEFEFTGKVTFNPNFNSDLKFCVLLPIKSKSLEELRKLYGFHSPFEFYYFLGTGKEERKHSNLFDD
ncbi:hypothetical protein ABK040_007000 [Willaertia magna]